MYPLGLLPVLRLFVPDPFALSVALAIPVLLLALWAYAILPAVRAARSGEHACTGEHSAPVHLPGSSLAHILPFFHRRFDFINQGFQLAGEAIYQFKLLRTPVIVLSGEAARRDFFQAKDLDLNAGFKFLSGAIPMVPGVTSNLESRRITLIHKRLTAAQTSDRLARLIPQILEDSRHTLSAWGYSGTIDPFEQLSELLFQTSVRCLAFAELADDRAAVKRLKELYDTLDTATTPATVLLPWLPVPSAVRRLLATKRIYDIVSAQLDARMKDGVARDDTPQMLIDAGDERLIIIGFVMGLLVAGARSTGTTASWLITFLSGHSYWRDKAADEVRRLIEVHATRPTSPTPPVSETDWRAPSPPPPPLRTTASESPSLPPRSQGATQQPPRPDPLPLSTLSNALANVPLSAWESDTPVLDALIRETLRVAEPHVAMRQYNPSLSHSSSSTSSASPFSFTSDTKHHPHGAAAPPLFLGGKAVPPGAFVMYPFSDVHLSSEIYKDPWRWDPGRAEMGLKAPYTYVGMGAGSTVCLGKRLAKLELKLVAALALLGARDLRAVDAAGAPLAELPRPNWNDILTCRPAKGSVFVRFECAPEPEPASAPSNPSAP